MPKLTKQHFKWLAEEVSLHINPHSLRQFTDMVARFSDNPNFDRERFEEAIEGVMADRYAQNDTPPELYKIDDEIPY